MPVDAESAPVPAILEFLPYRKRDGTTARDCLTHPYFAKRGYACIRVDMRGMVTVKVSCLMNIQSKSWTMPNSQLIGLPLRLGVAVMLG